MNCGLKSLHAKWDGRFIGTRIKTWSEHRKHWENEQSLVWVQLPTSAATRWIERWNGAISASCFVEGMLVCYNRGEMVRF